MKQYLKSQRGAMFGLDARIALAIFGGLSVVAGAAIISAVTETNTNALANELDNIQKGYTHYVLANAADTTSISNLLGSYITFTVADHPKYGAISLVQENEGTAAGGGDGCGATTDADCSNWVVIAEVPDETAVALQTLVDGTTNSGATDTTGTIRWINNTTTATQSDIMYKLTRTLNAGT